MIPDRLSDFELILKFDAKVDTIKIAFKPNREATALDAKAMEFTSTSDVFKSEPAPLLEINKQTAKSRPSVFFPTFRRIEGGFSFTRRSAGRPLRTALNMSRPIEVALSEMSSQLSVFDHLFVCSISTSDIVNLLTSRYADISYRTNTEQGELVKAMISEIERHGGSTGRTQRINESRLLKSTYAAIENIRKMTITYGERQQQFLQPFTTLSSFIEMVFADKGITITGGLELGIGQEKISSEFLSAGEKQILSFLVYNAFYENVPIFIDKPEISLHVDWQRILFPTLLEQKTMNQFVIATHSPFIYGQYSDKEVIIERAAWV